MANVPQGGDENWMLLSEAKEERDGVNFQQKGRHDIDDDKARPLSVKDDTQHHQQRAHEIGEDGVPSFSEHRTNKSSVSSLTPLSIFSKERRRRLLLHKNGEVNPRTHSGREEGRRRNNAAIPSVLNLPDMHITSNSWDKAEIFGTDKSPRDDPVFFEAKILPVWMKTAPQFLKRIFMICLFFLGAALFIVLIAVNQQQSSKEATQGPSGSSSLTDDLLELDGNNSPTRAPAAADIFDHDRTRLPTIIAPNSPEDGKPSPTQPTAAAWNPAFSDLSSVTQPPSSLIEQESAGDSTNIPAPPPSPTYPAPSHPTPTKGSTPRPVTTDAPPLTLPSTKPSSSDADDSVDGVSTAANTYSYPVGVTYSNTQRTGAPTSSLKKVDPKAKTKTKDDSAKAKDKKTKDDSAKAKDKKNKDDSAKAKDKKNKDKKAKDETPTCLPSSSPTIQGTTANKKTKAKAKAKKDKN